jgi:hypothetical protein
MPYVFQFFAETAVDIQPAWISSWGVPVFRREHYMKRQELAAKCKHLATFSSTRC